MAKKKPRDLDDMVDEWHNSPQEDTTPLHEYLGMTWEEYGLWTKDPSEWMRKYGEQ